MVDIKNLLDLMNFPPVKCPFILSAVPLNLIGCQFLKQFVMLKFFKRKLKTYVVLIVVALNIEIDVWLNLKVKVPCIEIIVPFKILCLKCKPVAIGFWYKPPIEQKAKHCNKQSSNKVRQQESSETYTTAEYRDDLRLASHSGSDIHNSNKNGDRSN